MTYPVLINFCVLNVLHTSKCYLNRTYFVRTIYYLHILEHRFAESTLKDVLEMLRTYDYLMTLRRTRSRDTELESRRTNSQENEP